MTNLIKFNNVIIQMAENFGFELSKEYLKLLLTFFQKQDISDKKLESSVVDVILNMTKDEWNKKFGYGGRPAVADWLSFLNKKAIPTEQMAIVELSTVKEIARNLTTDQAFLFENGTTNAVIEDLGGLRKIEIILMSDKGSSFFENQFIKTWVAFFEAKKESQSISGFPERFYKVRKTEEEMSKTMINNEHCNICGRGICFYNHKKISNPVKRISNKFAVREIHEKSLPHLGQPIGQLTSDRSAERSDSFNLLN